MLRKDSWVAWTQVSRARVTNLASWDDASPRPRAQCDHRASLFSPFSGSLMVARLLMFTKCSQAALSPNLLGSENGAVCLGSGQTDVGVSAVRHFQDCS